MKKPIQLWLPLLNVSWYDPSFSRDIQWAQKEWWGEGYIWLRPDLKETKRWTESIGPFNFHNCAFPSETFNLITVVNVTKEGIMHPLKGNAIPNTWNGRLPKNLLEQWLNTPSPSLVPTQTGEPSFELRVPYFQKDKMVYRNVSVLLNPGPAVPVNKIDMSTQTINFQWPPKESRLAHVDRIVSLEAESKELFGHYSWDNSLDNEGFSNVSNKEGRKAFHGVWAWPEPFNTMFPLGGGMDLWWLKEDMKKLVSEIDNEVGAQEKIAAQASKFTCEGWTTLEKQIVKPLLLENKEEELLFHVEGSYDITAKNIEDLLNHERYEEVFCSRIPITNVLGWEGYLWWELNNLVNVSKRNIKRCVLCGQIFTGSKNKRYCNETDNLACYRGRRSSSKRNERRKN
ncbi:hypothetical protein [Priestia aryabhattai]|uniref:hypothetical protein n=1 Tax=Priestia aryabhattai TaxID=412384 RepID=UPI001AD98279|nr:hypothetical protein [Priestia aryabhattai]QTL47328.1 hypothetical protein J5Z55_14615 [Priestia aryabhattai]